MSSSEAVAAEEPGAAALEPKEEPREDTESDEEREERDADMEGCDYSPSHKSNETRTSPDPRRHDDPPHEPESPRAAPACPPPLPPSGWFGLRP